MTNFAVSYPIDARGHQRDDGTQPPTDLYFKETTIEAMVEAFSLMRRTIPCTIWFLDRAVKAAVTLPVWQHKLPLVIEMEDSTTENPSISGYAPDTTYRAKFQLDTYNDDLSFVAKATLSLMEIFLSGTRNVTH